MIQDGCSERQKERMKNATFILIVIWMTNDIQVIDVTMKVLEILNKLNKVVEVKTSVSAYIWMSCLPP